MHIALFGTSADPPTLAHQQILVWLSYHYDQVAVWASDNPFKSHQTPLQHRTNMLQLLIDEIDPPRQTIQLHPELSSPRALITVERARDRWPDAELTYIIGSDLVAQLPRWYCVEELLQQVKLLVVPRPGYVLDDADLGELRELGATVAIADFTGLPVSSSAYRGDKDPDLITPPVQAYIHHQHLYECQDDAPKSLMPSGH
ncbi:nicotinate-nucleotide adenylyltransferase [Leptolyngbya sp. AN02str]|uniref:nicotinate-nucleotide adenylyltransferase n=1 Tax=Leptolyngbya sp. AN02str TaxID=3423363 RepID=UPI003D315535